MKLLQCKLESIKINIGLKIRRKSESFLYFKLAMKYRF